MKHDDLRLPDISATFSKPSGAVCATRTYR